MAIENPDERNPEEQPAVEFTGKLKGISTTETDWGTKTRYDVTISTYEQPALVLATLKTGTILKVKVAPHGKAEQANKRQKRK